MTTPPKTTGRAQSTRSAELVDFMARNPDAYDLLSDPEFTDAEQAQMDEAEAESRARQAGRSE